MKGTDPSNLLDIMGRTIDHLTQTQLTLVEGHKMLRDNTQAQAEQIKALTNNLTGALNGIDELMGLIAQLADRVAVLERQ